MQQQRSAGIFGRGLKGAKEGKETKDNAGAVDPNGAGGPEDSRTVWPCSIHHAGRVGGLYHLFAESAAVRGEWKQKLEEAIALRSLVNDSNKVGFELFHFKVGPNRHIFRSLKCETSAKIPSSYLLSWEERLLDGRTTSPSPEKSHARFHSVRKFGATKLTLFLIPTMLNYIATADGRGLVAVGCAEGVWIGLRSDKNCECRL